MIPFSQAAENNKEPILAILKTVFPARGKDILEVLEIGSGTGQHAVHFATHLPHIRWQTSDLPETHIGILARLAARGPDNARPPIALDVASDPWPVANLDGVYSANTLHIMSFEHVKHFFRGCGEVLKLGGFLCVYGPFKYAGEFTTSSNAGFDQWLKSQDRLSGIRDFEACDALARDHGLQLCADHAMPANNQLLVWEKTA